MLTRPEDPELDRIQLQDLQIFLQGLTPDQLKRALEQTLQGAGDKPTANTQKAHNMIRDLLWQ